MWGATIAIFGVVPMLWVGLVLLAVAGGADVISAVFRQAVQQRAVPDHLQGRLSGTFFAVVAGGPRLGDAETGVAASIGGPQFAVWSGGLACVVGVAVLLWRVPELWRDAGGGQPLGARATTEALSEASAEIERGRAGLNDPPARSWERTGEGRRRLAGDLRLVLGGERPQLRGAPRVAEEVALGELAVHRAQRVAPGPWSRPLHPPPTARGSGPG